jgi:thiol-disulfide isomerase/thioredoxin
MKKVILCMLALCCVPALARAQTPQTSTSPDPQKETPRPTVSIMKAANSVPSVRIEPLKVIPDKVFDHELKDLDGQSLYLSNYRGRVFVVNIWATWCGPCRMEIPELNKLYEEYAPRGVEFIGLTTENPATDAGSVREFVGEFKIKHKLGWIDAETAKVLLSGQYTIPQTFVVAADGHIVTLFRGFSDRMPRMIRDSIKKALNPPPVQESSPVLASPAPPAAARVSARP